MSEWMVRPLSEVAEVMMGQSPPGSTYNTVGTGLPFMQGSAEFGEHRPKPVQWCSAPKKVADPGDLLLSVRAPVGETNLADQRLAIGRGLAIVRAREGVLTGFLRLAIQQSVDEMLARSGSGMFSSITSKELKSFPVAVPGSADQARILGVISGIDWHTDSLAREIDRLLTAYRHASSLLWKTGDGDVATERPLSDVMTLDLERVILEPNEIYSSAGVLGAGKGMIDKGSFRGAATEYSAMNVLRANQVVMRKLTAWEGPITVVPASFDGYVASSEFPTFTLSSALAPEWMRHVCRTRLLWEEMKTRVTGSVQRRKRLNPDQLLAVALPVPPRDAQEQSAAALDALEANIAVLQREFTKLRSFRAALLSSLLSREIQIPESYDRLLEEVS